MSSTSSEASTSVAAADGQGENSSINDVAYVELSDCVEDSREGIDYTSSFFGLCLIGFLDAVEYGAVMPSLLLYMEEMAGDRPRLSHMYGLILSVFSAASLLSKPFLGILGDRRPFLETFVWTTLVATAGNILYFLTQFLVENFANENGMAFFWLLMTSRILCGVGCANTALTFAFVARTAKPEDRTRQMTYLSLVKVSGLAMGPAFNAITAHIHFTVGSLEVNEYNSPGLLVALFQIIALILLSMVLKEPPPYTLNNPTTNDVESSDVDVGEEPSLESNKVSVSAPLVLCFINILCYNFFFGTLEAITTPITKTSFDWTPLENSYVFMLLTLIALFMSVLVIMLSKRVEDRIFLLFAAVFAVLGPTLCYLLYFYDMRSDVYMAGVITWAVPASLAFSSNRSLFSRLIENSNRQAFFSSVLSVLASVGGILGPNWVGVSMGHRPKEGEDKHVRVAPNMFIGTLVVAALVLCLNVLILFIIPTDEPILALTKKNDDDSSEHSESEEPLVGSVEVQ